MNTPSSINRIITHSHCYTEGEWFCQDDISEETGKGKDVIANELRMMNDCKQVIMYTTPKNKTWYKKINQNIERIAKGSWRRHTNRELGVQLHECWGVL